MDVLKCYASILGRMNTHVPPVVMFTRGTDRCGSKLNHHGTKGLIHVFTYQGSHVVYICLTHSQMFVGRQGSLHYIPEHCNLYMVVFLYLGVEKKQHVSNGCKMEILLTEVWEGTVSCQRLATRPRLIPTPWMMTSQHRGSKR